MVGIYLKKPFHLELKEFQLPERLGEKEARIQFVAGGICGTDLRAYRGSLPYVDYPVRLGHELVGRIIETGSEVSLETGTRVVVQPNLYCGNCLQCKKGMTNVCLHKKTLGLNIDGGFADSFILSTDNVYPIPDEIDDETAVLIEPLAVVVHALRKSPVQEGMRVAVIGCGTEGLLAAVLARYLQADVVCVDINPRKLEIAKQLGIEKVFLFDELSHTDLSNYDVVVEAAGTKRSIEKAIRLVAPGGSLLLIGITNEEVLLPIVYTVRNEITLFGSIIYIGPKDFNEAMNYLKKKDFYVKPIIARKYRLSEYSKAFQDALSGNYGKIILRN